MDNVWQSPRRAGSSAAYCLGPHPPTVSPLVAAEAWRLSGRPGGCCPSTGCAACPSSAPCAGNCDACPCAATGRCARELQTGQPLPGLGLTIGQFADELLEAAQQPPLTYTQDLPRQEEPSVTVVTGDDPTEKPTPPTSMADGFPAAPPFRPGLWNFDASTYRLASGDTLGGLARLYLLQPQRWQEIYLANRGRPGVRASNDINVGTALLMPLEARDRARALYQALVDAGATIPGEEPQGAGPAAGLSTGAKVAIGVGVTAAVLGGIALASRPRRPR